MKIPSEDKWKLHIYWAVRTIFTVQLYEILYQVKNLKLCDNDIHNCRMAECLQMSWKCQWVTPTLMGFLLVYNCAQTSLLDWAITLWWSGSCVHWIMVNWDWKNEMWVIRQGNVEALDRMSGLSVCIYSVYIRFDALYRRKMLEDTWNKVAIIELPFMVVCRKCARWISNFYVVLGLWKAISDSWLCQEPQMQMFLPCLPHMVLCELWWWGAKKSTFTVFVRKPIALQTAALRPDKITLPDYFEL